MSKIIGFFVWFLIAVVAFYGGGWDLVGGLEISEDKQLGILMWTNAYIEPGTLILGYEGLYVFAINESWYGIGQFNHFFESSILSWFLFGFSMTSLYTAFKKLVSDEEEEGSGPVSESV